MICEGCALAAGAAAVVDLTDERERQFIAGGHRELCAGAGCTCQHRVPVPPHPEVAEANTDG